MAAIATVNVNVSDAAALARLLKAVTAVLDHLHEYEVIERAHPIAAELRDAAAELAGSRNARDGGTVWL